MKASDIMTPNPIFVEVSRTVRDAVDELLNADIRHIPVTQKGVLVGMLSDRDLQGHALPIDLQVSEPEKAVARLDTPVKEVMSTDVIFVNPETNLSEIIDLMIREKIGAIPVVSLSEQQLMGMISYIDVLRAVQSMEE